MLLGSMGVECLNLPSAWHASSYLQELVHPQMWHHGRIDVLHVSFPLNFWKRDHHWVKTFPLKCLLWLTSQKTVANERLCMVWCKCVCMLPSVQQFCEQLWPARTSSLPSGSGKLRVRNVFNCSKTVTCSFWDWSWDLRDECCWRAAEYYWKVLPPPPPRSCLCLPNHSAWRCCLNPRLWCTRLVMIPLGCYHSTQNHRLWTSILTITAVEMTHPRSRWSSRNLSTHWECIRAQCGRLLSHSQIIWPSHKDLC